MKPSWKMFDKINTSKIAAGAAMLMLNIGSKYVSVGLSKTQEAYLTTSLARLLIVFAVTFIGTKDIVTSLILTVMFFVFADYIFNENSRFCVIPRKFQKQIANEIDLDKDGIISDTELKTAIDVLSKARKRKQENSNISNYLK